MPRARTGSFWYDRNGDLYARVTWTDSKGKVREKRRKSISRTKREAREHIKDILEEIEDQGDHAIDAATLTFKQLVDYYKNNYAIEAEYDRKGIKTAGMRSWKDARRKADTLLEYFGGKKRVRDFTYGDLARFKAARLRAPTQRGTPRQIASVHRELEILRRMFRIAVQSRWIRNTPFSEGDPLIEQAEEHQRERIATKEEENALLAACDEHERRRHLRPVLILAFDTGFRPIEARSLRVKDVNFEDNCITVVSYKGKRRRERTFDMTARLRAEMLKLCEGKKRNDLIFEFKSVKRSFATAKRVAAEQGIDLTGFRLYDARHTATTRLVRRGMSLEEAGKLMGHTQPKTTWRYMHVDKSRRRKAAELLEKEDEE